MSSYLRSWLTGTTSIESSNSTPETVEQLKNPELNISEHEEQTSETDSDVTDTPPAFPALNSVQRLGSTSKVPESSIPSILSDSGRVPSLPSKNALRVPGIPTQGNLGSGLMPPPSISASGTLSLPPSTTKKPPSAKKLREKVALAPGFGPLDWAALKSSGADLRGVETLLKVTPSMLKEHNKKDDAWSAFNGKVYNITPYLPFHPGGEKELMRVAGRDGTKLFALTHAWVNVDFMLDACLVGFLVSESYGSS